MAYNFSSQGTGIKVINTVNGQEFLFLDGTNLTTYVDNGGNAFRLRSVDAMLTFYQPDIGTIAGAAPAGTVDGIVNQISALMPMPVTQGATNVVNVADPVTPANKANVTAAGALKTDGSAVTQPVSGSVAVTALPAIPAGANNIGSVNVAALPALPTGTNSIGSVSNIPANVDTAAIQTLTAAAAGVNSADQTNANGRGVKVVINVTAIAGTTPSLTVTLQGKDAASGVYYNQLVSAAITAVGTTVLTIYPGLAAAANVTANDILPRTWRIISAIAGTTPAVTATIGASVII